MSQRHLDRLRAMDASFLLQEGPTSHAHVGGVAILDGPPPSVEALRRQIASRLDRMQRYRQRLVHTALDRSRPIWADDDSFDLDYHVRHTALPAPGDRAQFQSAVASAYSQPLDRSRPLWEIWLVEGLQGNAFALIFKVHHAMVDGSAAVDLLKILCDMSPSAAPSENGDEPWRPHPTPSGLGLMAIGACGAVSAGVDLAARAVRTTRDPGGAIKSVREVLEGTAGLVWELLRASPKTPLTTQITPHRRFVAVPCRLDDAKLVKNTFGGTVNDVVLAVVTGAVRKFLLGRDVDTSGLELSALVPVSVRREDERGQLGNRIAVLRGSLPVHVEDPVARLGVVTQAMAALKSSRQARATEVVLSAQDYLPPMLLPITTRVNVSPRLFNVMVTNVPGPQLPLYVLGRQIRELCPIALLQPDHALAIAVTSYNGQLNFGVLGDYEALRDIDVVADGIRAGLAELVAKAQVTTRAGEVIQLRPGTAQPAVHA
jgi:diacylglycerol O-acyltransferase / wax synthase